MAIAHEAQLEAEGSGSGAVHFGPTAGRGTDAPPACNDRPATVIADPNDDRARRRNVKVDLAALEANEARRSFDETW
jgi:hypothetical protein